VKFDITKYNLYKSQLKSHKDDLEAAEAEIGNAIDVYNQAIIALNDFRAELADFVNEVTSDEANEKDPDHEAWLDFEGEVSVDFEEIDEDNIGLADIEDLQRQFDELVPMKASPATEE
jgi:hypothetical protein